VGRTLIHMSVGVASASQGRVVSRYELVAQGLLSQQGVGFTAQPNLFPSMNMTPSPAPYQTSAYQAMPATAHQLDPHPAMNAGPMVPMYQAPPAGAPYQSGPFPATHGYSHPMYHGGGYDPVDATVRATNEYIAQPIGYGVKSMHGMASEVFSTGVKESPTEVAHSVVNPFISALGAGIFMPLGYHVGAGLNYLAKSFKGRSGSFHNHGYSDYGPSSDAPLFPNPHPMNGPRMIQPSMSVPASHAPGPVAGIQSFATSDAPGRIQQSVPSMLASHTRIPSTTGVVPRTMQPSMFGSSAEFPSNIGSSSPGPTTMVPDRAMQLQPSAFMPPTGPTALPSTTMPNTGMQAYTTGVPGMATSMPATVSAIPPSSTAVLDAATMAGLPGRSISTGGMPSPGIAPDLNLAFASQTILPQQAAQARPVAIVG